MKKIDLSEPGLIVFLGTMNAMPMMYARELRKMGQSVLYFVDVKKENTLSRPECHYLDIKYPYPDWIIENIIFSGLLISLFPYIFFNMIKKNIRKYSTVKIKAIFFSGQFIALAPYFKKFCDPILYFLSYGEDIEIWSHIDSFPLLRTVMKNKSFIKYMPARLADYCLKRALIKNSRGVLDADAIFCFYPGMSLLTDAVVEKYRSLGIPSIYRFDTSFDFFSFEDRSFHESCEKLVIICPVRFFYKTNFGQIKLASKGNDLILEGLYKYFLLNPNIEVHFFNKGPDVSYAKKFCEETGLSKVAIWHSEMSLIDLIKLYRQSHVCFDQVGEHWVGGVGMYAMYMGKTLIANFKNLTFLPLEDIPALQASTSDEICTALARANVLDTRTDLYERSKIFAETYFSSLQLIGKITY